MSIARRGKGKEIAREGIFHEIDANNQVLIPPAVVAPRVFLRFSIRLFAIVLNSPAIYILELLRGEEMSQDDDDETDREFSSRFKNLNTVEEWGACWK